MSDLVKRLRAVDHMNVEECFLDSHLYAKAADAIEQLQRQLAEAVANEREACAKVADGFRDKWGHAGGFGGHSAGARIIAAIPMYRVQADVTSWA